MKKQPRYSRRRFLQTSALLSAGSWLLPTPLGASPTPNPVILIISGWQDVNIGDIAHTPGLIALLKKRLPNECKNHSLETQ